ncbi:sensor histidine kinase [Flindersiella endophytica]
MTASPTPVPPRWLLRHPHWPLIALHVPLAMQAAVYVSIGMETGTRSPVVGNLLAVIAIGLQLRHSLAAARGTRPARWGWSLVALLLLVYTPIPWFGQAWVGLQVFALASVLMLLRGRLAMAAAVVILVVGVVRDQIAWQPYDPSALQIAIFVSYSLIIPIVYGGALVGGARLVHAVNELDATRTELATAAVGQERLRVSRDLHDLLGQSLSAISLKGDLALRLLSRDPAAARAEVESLTGVARDALRDIKAITRDEHGVSLRTELDGAAALLAAAGVDTRLEVADPLPALGSGETALAWAVREGTTNLLRHSEAQRCTIAVERQDGVVRLEISNDGIRGEVAADGSGLPGIAERARAASGTSSSEVAGDWFRLRVEIPIPTSIPGEAVA